MITEESLYFRYNIDENGTPISLKIDRENKQVTSAHCTIQLEQVPDELHRVAMFNEDGQPMTEVFNRDEVAPNSFYVDYGNGIAYFHSSQSGKFKLYDYYGKGLIMIGSSRIFDEHDVTGKGIVLSLQEIIDKGKECIQTLFFMGNAKQIVEKLETLNSDLEYNIEQGQSAVDLIRGTGNIAKTITTSSWVGTAPNLSYTWNHGLNTKNLSIDVYDNDTDETLFWTTTLVDNNNIKIESDEAKNIRIVLSAKYHMGGLDTKEEILAARQDNSSSIKYSSIGERMDVINAALGGELKSPDGTKWKLVVDNNGNLSVAKR